MADVVEPGERNGLSRRQMIKASAVAGAAVWTAPVIIDSLSSPAAAGSIILGPGCHYTFFNASTSHCNNDGQGTPCNGALACGDKLRLETCFDAITNCQGNTGTVTFHWNDTCGANCTIIYGSGNVPSDRCYASNDNPSSGVNISPDGKSITFPQTLASNKTYNQFRDRHQLRIAAPNNRRAQRAALQLREALRPEMTKMRFARFLSHRASGRRGSRSGACSHSAAPTDHDGSRCPSLLRSPPNF